MSGRAGGGFSINLLIIHWEEGRKGEGRRGGEEETGARRQWAVWRRGGV